MEEAGFGANLGVAYLEIWGHEMEILVKIAPLELNKKMWVL